MAEDQINKLITYYGGAMGLLNVALCEGYTTIDS